MKRLTLKKFQELEKNLVKKYNLIKVDIKNPNGTLSKKGYKIETIYGTYNLYFRDDNIQAFGRFEDVSKVKNDNYSINTNTGKYNFHFDDVLNIESFLDDVIK